VAIVNQLPSTTFSPAETRVNTSVHETSFHSSRCNESRNNAFSRIGSGLPRHSTKDPSSQPLCKRPRTSEHWNQYSSQVNGSASNAISFATPRQVTLDSWRSPVNHISPPLLSTSTGIKLPLSQSSSRSLTPSRRPSGQSPIGLPPKSVMEYWKKSGTPENSSQRSSATPGISPETSSHKEYG
jgi:hypothetical protein